MPVSNTALKTGRLYIFEGPDGVGKSTIVQEVATHLKNKGADSLVLSFPGRMEGTLGKLVYDLHHKPLAFGIKEINDISLQLLHIAAHIDCIKRDIIPALSSGRSVLLDRFWWSTLSYGIANGIHVDVLNLMIELEKNVWGDICPDMAFLITRPTPFRKELTSKVWKSVCRNYTNIAQKEQDSYPVKTIKNTSTLKESVARVIGIMEAEQSLLPFLSKELDSKQGRSSSKSIYGTLIHVNRKWLPTKTTAVFDTYWKFAAERQSVFFNRVTNSTWPVTHDPILQIYKFTNAYRASDRVSQYLIRNVIYSGEQTAEEIFFRIILFKTFNKIETWETLRTYLGEITYRGFDINKYENILSTAMRNKQSIYSAAYIMPSGGKSFGYSAKHSNHLKLIELMMRESLPARICDAKSMQQVFDMLRAYPMIGDFLAYQYAIDINYSEMIDFSEMSFVVPGPGAKDGLRKCFSDFGGFTEVDLIKRVADRQEEEFERLGINFQSLWGRRLQLIDCQNLFCEVDKYARIAHPEILGLSGRTRIKQKFCPKKEPICYFFPPKWGLNDLVEQAASKTTAPK